MTNRTPVNPRGFNASTMPDAKSLDGELIYIDGAGTKTFYLVDQGQFKAIPTLNPVTGAIEAAGTRRQMARSGVRLSGGVIATYSAARVTAGGAAASAAETAAVQGPLERLMRSTVWPKLKVLWIPLGADGDLNAMRTCLLEVSGTPAMTNTGFLAGDYTLLGGLQGAAAKKLVTTFNPSVHGSMSATNWGFGSFLLEYNTVGGTTVISGTDTSSAFYLGFASGSDVSQFYTTQVAHPATRGLMAVQYANGAISTYYRAFNRANLTIAAGALPNSAMSINMINGAFGGNAIHAGFYVADGLTTTELGVLGDFFTDVNLAIGRAVYSGNKIAAFGDSVTGGTGVSTASNIWDRRVASLFGLTFNEQGLGGRSVSALAAASQFSDATRTDGYVYTCLRGLGALNFLALGLNDTIYGNTVSQFSIDYNRMVDNLIAAGARPETWVLMSPYYAPGTVTAPISDSLSQQFAAVIKATAARYSMPYVDVLNGRLRGQSTANWDAGGIHPNDAMHALIAQDVRDAIAAGMTILATPTLA